LPSVSKVATVNQCRCGRPVPQQQQDFVPPPQAGAAVAVLSAMADAKTDNFLVSFFEPQCGHAAPFQLLERTRISLSRSHFSQ